MAVKFVEQREVPIEELFPHPDNPNRGSVDDLADSLSEFGQFRSIVGRPDGQACGNQDCACRYYRR